MAYPIRIGRIFFVLPFNMLLSLERRYSSGCCAHNYRFAYLN